MAKGTKRVSGVTRTVETTDKRRTDSVAKANEFTLEVQTVPADALKPNQSFWLMGQPDVDFRKNEDGNS